MAFLADSVLDGLLNQLVTNVTTLFICSQEPTTYAAASSTYKLGTKTPITVGAPGARTPNGRKATVPSFSDGVVSGTGTATHWALCSGSVLLATGSLSASQVVTAGNSFSLAAFDIGVPAAT